MTMTLRAGHCFVVPRYEQSTECRSRPGVDRDVVARRLLVLNECLSELSLPDRGDPQKLASDSVLRAAVERWLQLAIEACIDIASHVIADAGWTPPATGRDAFFVLASGKRP
jgi:uncharacterized protein YutE (UPF0331/DUF86 family)